LGPKAFSFSIQKSSLSTSGFSNRSLHPNRYVDFAEAITFTTTVRVARWRRSELLSQWYRLGNVLRHTQSRARDWKSFSAISTRWMEDRHGDLPANLQSIKPPGGMELYPLCLRSRF